MNKLQWYSGFKCPQCTEDRSKNDITEFTDSVTNEVHLICYSCFFDHIEFFVHKDNP